MQIVNVLRHENALHIGLLGAVFLELDDGLMTLIDLRTFRQFDEVVVPLPDCCRVLLEEVVREDLHRVGLSTILLRVLPEAIVTPESGDATRSADTCPRKQRDPLATKHALGSLRSCLDLRLMLVLLR